MAELRLVPITPLGLDIDRDTVRMVWDEFVVRQQDGGLQSIEDRALMACLRSLYVSLPPTEKEPDEEPSDSVSDT
jgi:hypothetical protein